MKLFLIILIILSTSACAVQSNCPAYGTNKVKNKNIV